MNIEIFKIKFCFFYLPNEKGFRRLCERMHLIKPTKNPSQVCTGTRNLRNISNRNTNYLNPNNNTNNNNNDISVRRQTIRFKPETDNKKLPERSNALVG
jgi:hypothetical protein